MPLPNSSTKIRKFIKKKNNKFFFDFSNYLYVVITNVKMIIETYNIQLQMGEAYAKHWLQVLESARNAYNFCTDILTKANKGFSLKTIHSLCYDKVRKNFSSLSSQMAIKCEQAAASALKSIKSNKHKDAKISKRKSLTMVLDKRLYGILNVNGITLTGPQARKRALIPFCLYPKVKDLLENNKACDPTIFYRDGKFWLSIPFEIPEKPVSSDTCIGVDLGMRQLFVTSEGKSFSDKEYQAKRRQTRYLKSKLKAKNTKSAKRHLKKLKHKEHNQSKDMCYRAAKSLLSSTEAGVIVLEDLTKIKKSTSRTSEGYKRAKHNNAVSQVPFYMFRQILAYKAPLAGKQVETVSPMYTSQMDSRTNNRDGVRRGRRYICCDGLVFDADWNAAINIGQRSKHPVSSSQPLDGCLVPLTGRHQSTCQSSETL